MPVLGPTARESSDRAYVAVVCYYRRGPDVMHTIDALRRQSSPPTEIVLVDNDSRDGVMEQLRSAGRLEGVAIVTPAANLGYAGGMNAGAAKAVELGADTLLFVTHELVMEAACAAELLTVAADPGVVAVGPSLRLPDGQIWANGGRLDRRGGARHHRDALVASREVDWLDGACLLIPTWAYRRVGGFDESYFLYWEDVDMALRLAEHGQLRVAPAAVAVQAPSGGSGAVYYVSRNRLWLWRRRGRHLVVALSLVELLAWGVKRAITDRPADLLSVIRGCRDGLLRDAAAER